MPQSAAGGNDSMKVLILSCGTGGGHNAAGRAIEEEFLRRNIDCTMKDFHELTSRNTAKKVKNIYLWSTMKAPFVFKYAYKAGAKISSSKYKSPVYAANIFNAPKLKQYIEENGYDAIVTPHLFPAETLTRIRKKNQIAFKTFFIATDYTCTPFTEETESDYYFIPHPALEQEYISRGIRREKLVSFGIPVSGKFGAEIKKETARKELSLPQEKPIYLIMSGSMGYGDIGEMIYQLSEETEKDAYILAVTGENQPLKKELEQRFTDDKKVTVLGYTDQVALYMKAADAVFTKPGGLTSTEAAASRIPIVHTKPIPGCEDKNCAFFKNLGMSVFYDGKNMKKIVETLNRSKEAMLKSQGKNIDPKSAEKICDFIEKQMQ